MEEFVRFREVLTPSGVYVLLHHGKVVYAGKSKNIFSRMSKHYTGMVRHLKGMEPYRNHDGPVILFDDVMVKFCAVDVLDLEEVQLIQRYLPQYNIRLNRPRYDLSHLPAFQELLSRARNASGRAPNYARMRVAAPRALHKPPRLTHLGKLPLNG